MIGIQGAARRLEARGETGPPIETRDRASSPEIIVTSPDAAGCTLHGSEDNHERYLGRRRSFQSEELTTNGASPRRRCVSKNDR